MVSVLVHVHSHTHTHTHTKQKKKNAYSSCKPSDNTGMPGTTQTLEPSAANPPGAGLVTRRRTVRVSQIEVEEPKVPQRTHTA